MLAGAGTTLLVGCAVDGALAPRSPTAARTLGTLWLLLSLAGIVLLIVVGVLVVASARRGDEGREPRRVDHLMIVGGGVILPAVILVGLMVRNVSTLANEPLTGDLQVDVVGHQYWWEVRYPDAGAETANEVHIPTGRRVELHLTTDDVIHSVWVPQLGGKVDMVPGRTNTLVLQADAPGRYEGKCAEFCGLQHAYMLFVVVAHDPDEFDAWLAAETADASEPGSGAAADGREVFLGSSCVGCHAIRGVSEVGDRGPDLTHLASREEIGAGILPLEPDTLARWIVNPQEVKAGALMPPQPLRGDEVDQLVAYLMSLD